MDDNNIYIIMERGLAHVVLGFCLKTSVLPNLLLRSHKFFQRILYS